MSFLQHEKNREKEHGAVLLLAAVESDVGSTAPLTLAPGAGGGGGSGAG